MPDSNQTNNNTQNNNDSNSNQNTGTGQEVLLAVDHNTGDDQKYMDTVAQIVESGGYKVTKLGIGPNYFASASYDSSQSSGKKGVYLIAAGLTSIADLYDGNTSFEFSVFGIRADASSGLNSRADFESKPISTDWHGDCISPSCSTLAGKNYPQINEYIKSKATCVFGMTPEELGQEVLKALGGKAGSIAGGNSGGGAQIKDKTFEKCIRRICAATDSVFVVESNAAVLFPYTDWMAFTLRQKINTIKANDIDPNIFTMEYGNDGFYNKVTIAWGGDTLPERFKTNDEGKQIERNKFTPNYTLNDIYKNMRDTNFDYDTWSEKQSKLKEQKEAKKKAAEEAKKNKTTDKTKTEVVNKKEKTTQTITEDNDGTLLLSEQYDSLVDKYGEMEKRVESAAPDFETAQYIINALLIQYIRDYNNMCKCRALTDRKYIGGTFYAVENPFTKESELFYLNGYTIRTQKNAPMYHDLDFRYGPEGAEEILDYQTLSGGAASGGGATTGGGSANEEQVWTTAAKIKYAHANSTQDPEQAWKMFGGKEDSSSTDCYGMSAYLYYCFNNRANIPCQVVGDSGHHVVMIDRGSGFVETRDEYRKYNFDYNFKWRSNQNTTVLLPAPGGKSSTSSGNTNSNNTNGGNRG